MTRYKVLEPLAADRVYQPGEMVELGEADGAWLLKSGVVGEMTGSPSPGSSGTDKPTAAADLIAVVKQTASVGALDNLAAGETRKTVLDAIAARRKEIGG
ncbi:MAG: hypothetical protein FWD79_05680 [Desulfobulbus sp.]|nr:hypothetical protein [Desulfobulbus sp.]